MILASIFINSLSILILYVLVYSLFYQVTNTHYKLNDIRSELTYQNNQTKNLVQDINHNNRMLKYYLNAVH